MEEETPTPMPIVVPKNQLEFINIPSDIEAQIRSSAGFIKKLMKVSLRGFRFENTLMILEEWKDLWMHYNLYAVHEITIVSDSWLYSIINEVIFEEFLKQINAISYELTEERLVIRCILEVSDRLKQWNPSPTTILAHLQSYLRENASLLRNSLSESLTEEQRFFTQIATTQGMRTPPEQLRNLFLSDTSFIFLEKTKLTVHNTQKLPIKKQERPRLSQEFAQQAQQQILISESKPMLEVNDSKSGILKAIINHEIQKMNAGFQLSKLFYSIQQHMYFTFYDQRFLILHYTVFARVIQEKNDSSDQSHLGPELFKSGIFTEGTALFAVSENQEDHHELLSIEEDREWNYPQLQLLFGKQLAQIIAPQRFMEVFTRRINHGTIASSTDISELPKLFKLGSVLIYSTGLIARHACVYLEADLVIQVTLHDQEDKKIRNAHYTDEGEQEARDRIFKFSQFEEFMLLGTGQSTSEISRAITEIRFTFQPYDKNELVEKATLMSQEVFKYDQYRQNSEHLAFLLASGFKFSSMENNIFTSIAETFSSIFKSSSK